MKNFKKILQWIIIAELVFVAFFVTSIFVPLPGNIEFKIVQSGSMEPSVPVGSVVVVIPSATYAVGDIITFGSDTRNRIPTTHRIVDIEREGGSIRYVTKGDANEEKDNKLTKHGDIIGGVAFTVPRIGYVIDFARTKNGFLLMVVIPALLIMLDEAMSIVFTLSGMRRRKSRAHVVHRKQAIERISNSLPNMHARQKTGIDGYSIVLRSLHT